MTTSKKPLWSADDLAAIRNFISTVDICKRPNVEELRVISNILQRATAPAKKSGPKSYWDIFEDSRFDTPRARRYQKIIRAVNSQIAKGIRQSSAITLVADQMHASEDTVFRVWTAHREYLQSVVDVIAAEESDEPIPQDELELLEALDKIKAQNLKN